MSMVCGYVTKKRTLLTLEHHKHHSYSNVTNITINTNTGTRVGLFEKLGSSLELENVERELAKQTTRE